MASTPADVHTRSRRVDAQRNRLKIIDAAHRVLARDGLAAQMVDIARTAEVGPGTVYRHFPTRGDLVDAVLEKIHVDLTARARAAVSLDEPGDAFVEYMTDLAGVLSENLALADDAAERGADEWRAYNQELADAIGELLAAAQSSKAIRDDVTTADVVGLIIGVTRGARGSPDAWKRSLAIVMDGLRSPPSGAARR